MFRQGLVLALFLALATFFLPVWAGENPAGGESGDFPPAKMLTKLAPRNLTRTLVAYERTLAMRAKNQRVKVPRMTFLLDQGHQLSGVVFKTDFDQNRFALLLAEKRFTVNVAFIEFRQVKSFIFHDVDLCPEFLDELSKEG